MSQSNFTDVFIKVMIQMDFSTSSPRNDLFQRPASRGGYFEIMRSVVADVINTNSQIYNGKVGSAATCFGNGDAYKNANPPDYRRAWQEYRNAYLQATISY